MTIEDGLSRVELHQPVGDLSTSELYVHLRVVRAELNAPSAEHEERLHELQERERELANEIIRRAGAKGGR